MVTTFKINHTQLDDDLLHDWLDAYALTKKVILGGRPLSGLTTQAYYRTLEGLQRKENGLA